MNLRATLASNLRTQMQRSAKLSTQAKLAKAAGITQSSVNRVLHSEAGASIDTVEKLSDGLQVPAIMLLADPHQANFLQAWLSLNDEDQARVLSFMQIANLKK